MLAPELISHRPQVLCKHHAAPGLQGQGSAECHQALGRVSSHSFTIYHLAPPFRRCHPQGSSALPTGVLGDSCLPPTA